MSLRARINDSLKEAMKAGDKRRVSTLRLMNSAIKDKDILSRTEGHADYDGKVGGTTSSRNRFHMTSCPILMR